MGSFGKVYLVKCKLDSKIYALKMLNKDHLTLKGQIKNSVNEQLILKKFRYKPFVAQLRFSFQNDTKLFLVTDYYENGELFYHLKKLKFFETDVLIFYSSEIIIGIEQLHNKQIVYRDLKPENIMLDAQGHAVIVDYGLAKPLTPEDKYLTHEFVGTSEYLPPEVIQRNKYSFYYDVWNIGCFMFELMTGNPPFVSSNRDVLYRKILNSEPVFEEGFDKDACDLIKNILIKNPSARPKISYIKEHAFFSKISWNKVQEMEYDCPIFDYLKNKFDIKRIHDYYSTKKPSRKTDYYFEKARDEVKNKLRTARREYPDYYYDYREN